MLTGTDKDCRHLKLSPPQGDCCCIKQDDEEARINLSIVHVGLLLLALPRSLVEASRHQVVVCMPLQDGQRLRDLGGKALFVS